jgi:2-keto-4-pentenoate hydratase/2-oxohepta-3-ene-1,7-dioic acid hydratase in catechol pathway
MRFASCVFENRERLGVIKGGHAIDVLLALGFIERGNVPNETVNAAVRTVRSKGGPPADMIDLLARGEDYWNAVDVIASALAEASPRVSLPGLFTPLVSARLRPPIPRPPKIVCVGLNYADHAREQGIEPPKEPLLFLKSSNTVCGPGDPIRLPPNSTQVDYEAEFAVVMGKGGSRIPVDKAHEYVAGYMILNDVSARDMQFGDKQWFRGKSCDTFAPCGPWIVTKDEVSDPHNLRISLTLNGVMMQDSNTSNIIFKVPHLISYLSQSLTWEPGDLISTGTPPGVGVFRKPPVFLKPGDTVSITVDGLGTLTNPVVS